MSDTVEKCRQEAKQFPGVTYDKDRNKFVAQINLKGKRVSLGRFETAAAAGLAYAKMREANPLDGKVVRGPKPLGQEAPSKSFLIVCADAVAEKLSDDMDMALEVFVGEVWRYLVSEKLTADGITFEVMTERLVAAAHESDRFTIANFEDGDIVIFGRGGEEPRDNEMPAGREARRRWLIENAASSPYLKDVFEGMRAAAG